MRYRTDEELEEIAEKLLKDVGLWNVKWLDLMTVIVALKRRFRGFNGYERVPDHHLADSEAQWDSRRGVIVMRESVFRAMQDNKPRARFTVAEEIGHFVLQHSGIRNRSVRALAIEKSVPLIRHEEGEAKRFAPRLLAPAKLIPRDATVDDIAARFGFSEQTALFRKEEKDRMIRRAEGRDRQLPSFVIDFLNEAKRRR